MRGRVFGKESDTTEDVLSVLLSVIFQSFKIYTDCVFNILTLKIFLNLCVIQLAFLRGLWDNDFSILIIFIYFYMPRCFPERISGGPVVP